MQSLLTTLLALLLAHLLADFPLQPEGIALNKGKHLWASAAHIAIHYAAAWACLLLFTHVPYLSLSSQVIVCVYLLVHLGIDTCKYSLIAGKVVPDNVLVFLVDQALHCITICVAASLLAGSSALALLHLIQPSPVTKLHIVAVSTIYAGIVFGGGYLIRYLTRGLARDARTEDQNQLKNAGLYIGWVERFLILTAISVQAPALVGLILTGKSIARFPELKEPRFAEYFLIGTLSSTALAVIGGLLIGYMINGTLSLK